MVLPTDPSLLGVKLSNPNDPIKQLYDLTWGKPRANFIRYEGGQYQIVHFGNHHNAIREELDLPPKGVLILEEYAQFFYDMMFFKRTSFLSEMGEDGNIIPSNHDDDDATSEMTSVDVDAGPICERAIEEEQQAAGLTDLYPASKFRSKLLNAISRDPDPEEKTKGPAKGVLLGGSPGIGKSLCLFYILFERLIAKQPTLYQTSWQQALYFCDDGVYTFDFHRSAPDPMYFAQALSLTPNLWCLIDGLPEGVSRSVANGGFFIQAMYRDGGYKRDYWFRKLNGYTFTYVMKPMAISELLIVRSLAESTVDPAALVTFYTTWSCSAGIALNTCMHWKEHKAYVEVKLRTLTRRQFRALAYDCVSLDFKDKRTGMLFAVRLLPDGTRQMVRVEPSGPEVAALVEKRFGRSWKEKDR